MSNNPILFRSAPPYHYKRLCRQTQGRIISICETPSDPFRLASSAVQALLFDIALIDTLRLDHHAV